MMTPAEQIAALYDTDSPRTFREDLEAHMLCGYVFATPDYMLMGRAVDSSADPEEIRNPWHVFPRDRQDCWLIYAFASVVPGMGLVKTCLTHLPYPLPLVSWERKRDQQLSFYQLDHENLRLLPSRRHMPPAFLRRRRQNASSPGLPPATDAADAGTAPATASSSRGAEHVCWRCSRGAAPDGREAGRLPQDTHCRGDRGSESRYRRQPAWLNPTKYPSGIG